MKALPEGAPSAEEDPGTHCSQTRWKGYKYQARRQTFQGEEALVVDRGIACFFGRRAYDDHPETKFSSKELKRRPLGFQAFCKQLNEP